jgi:hypothetical protein
MDIRDPDITRLKDMVTAVQEEFDLAVSCHEVWKPSAFNADLHGRMTMSYAGHAFLVVRMALRREVVLALARIWDTNPKAARMSAINELLGKPGLIGALAKDRAERIGLPESAEAMRSDLAAKAEKVRRLVCEYSKNGSRYTMFAELRHMRNTRLAHRQFEPSPTNMASELDHAIEQFYSDTSNLIRLLMSLVNATAYDPAETAQVYEWHATKFWAGVRSEKVEGHPHFKRSNRTS